MSDLGERLRAEVDRLREENRRYQDDYRIMNSAIVCAADEVERLGRCNEQLSKSHAEAINAQNEWIRQLRADLAAAYSEMSKQFPAKPQIENILIAAADEIERHSKQRDAMNGLVGKHWKGCEGEHPHCAILKLQEQTQ